MNQDWAADALRGAAFLGGVLGHLRRPIGVAEAREALRRRRAGRAEGFLALLRRSVYGVRGSPYRPLLEAAGCAYGDLEATVRRDGVESALALLFRAGVFLSVGELKGKQPVRRVDPEYVVGRARLRNARWVVTEPGERPALLHSAMFRDQGVAHTLIMEAVGGLHWRHAYWGILADTAAVTLLRHAGGGMEPGDWFTHLDPREPGLPARDRWSPALLGLAGALAGRPLPRPRYVPVDAPQPVLQWMADQLASGHTPHLQGSTSLMVGLAGLASEIGLDLTGARFTIGGEPVTSRRLQVIHRSGALAFPRYASRETLVLAEACRGPVVADEVHLFDDLHAIIQAGPDNGAGLPADALLVSSVRPGAPLVLLNVSLGDRADVSRRACGCPLEALGWTTHLSRILSFEKLTAGGVMFLDSELIGVLEKALPARFGGGPLDYQLVEEEGDDGLPRVRLLVSEAVGPVDLAVVAEVFLDAVTRQARSSGILWRQGRWLRVERGRPAMTRSGKIHHLVAGPGPLDRGP